MHHTREEVIERATREFRLLDRLVSRLTPQEWNKRVPRPETKDPWTVKDTVAHVTHFKANIIRSLRGERKPAVEQGLTETDENHVIYMRWHRRPASEVLVWHRQVQKDLLAALRHAPEEWFTGRERHAEWPFDLDGHSSYHRIKDIEAALGADKARSQRGV